MSDKFKHISIITCFAARAPRTETLAYVDGVTVARAGKLVLERMEEEIDLFVNGDQGRCAEITGFVIVLDGRVLLPTSDQEAQMLAGILTFEEFAGG